MAGLMDAITQGVAASLSPDGVVTRDYLRTITDEKQQDLIDRKAATIDNLQKKLAKAKSDSDTPVTVIDAYERLLLQASGG